MNKKIEDGRKIISNPNQKEDFEDRPTQPPLKKDKLEGLLQLVQETKCAKDEIKWLTLTQFNKLMNNHDKQKRKLKDQSDKLLEFNSKI